MLSGVHPFQQAVTKQNFPRNGIPLKLRESVSDVSPFLANLNRSDTCEGFPVVDPSQLAKLGEVGLERTNCSTVCDERRRDDVQLDILSITWLFSQEFHQLELSKPARCAGIVLQGRQNVPNLGYQSGCPGL